MSPKPRVQKRLYYKIGEACKALDIQPYVLRYWETEFPALSPNKSRSGQRVYSEKELGVIRRIKELLYTEGYTIAGAKKKLEAELASGLLPREPLEEDAGEAESGAAGAATAEAGRGEPVTAGGETGLEAGGLPAAAGGAGAQTGSAGSVPEAEAAASGDPAGIRGAGRPIARRVGRAGSGGGAGAAAEASTASAQQSLLLDTRAAERVESMRQGIQQALDEAREILTLLDSKSPSRR